MEEPTEAQIKEFWEWRGIYCHTWGEDYGLLGEVTCKTCGKSNLKYLDDVGKEWTYLPEIPYRIDLNNLFKYAVPKAWELGYSIYMHIGKTLTTCLAEPYRYEVSKCKQIQDKDPALALFWALWQVKEAE